MSYNHYNQIYLHTTQPLGIETMNNRPFPPIILTHLTTNTARYYGVCQHGLNLFLKQKNLTNCTAISVSHLLEILVNDNPSDQIYYRQWFSLLSGAQGSGYLNGNTTGDEDGDGFGAEWSSGDGYDSELTYDSSNSAWRWLWTWKPLWRHHWKPKCRWNRNRLVLWSVLPLRQWNPRRSPLHLRKPSCSLPKILLFIAVRVNMESTKP